MIYLFTKITITIAATPNLKCQELKFSVITKYGNNDHMIQIAGWDFQYSHYMHNYDNEVSSSSLLPLFIKKINLSCLLIL